MAQLNMHITPEFEAELRQYMARRGIKHKAEAIRVALHEALAQSQTREAAVDYRQWRGLAVGDGQRPGRLTDDELWDGC